MSSSHTGTSSVAIVGQRAGGDGEALAAFAAARGLPDACWYAPRDADDLDVAVRAGTVQTVVFGRLTDMLEAGWSERLAPESWRAAGVQVVCMDTAGAGSDDPLATLVAWSAWRKRQRRRQAVAGVILSVAALTAAFLVVRCGG